MEAIESCPDESSIDDFVRGTLPLARRTELEAHIDACSSCADLVTAMVRAYGEPVGAGASVADVSADGTPTLLGSAASEPIPVELVPGTAVGRYRVLEVVGSGGMGVVYAAFDPELDRKVALKLLHSASTPGSGASQRRARLQREAQALARLSHPHVIGIYDVGTYAGDVFIAMEFVSGPTLGQWREQRERKWPERSFASRSRSCAATRTFRSMHAR
jgi:hypothetical protein